MNDIETRIKTTILNKLRERGSMRISELRDEVAYRDRGHFSGALESALKSPEIMAVGGQLISVSATARKQLN